MKEIFRKYVKINKLKNGSWGWYPYELKGYKESHFKRKALYPLIGFFVVSLSIFFFYKSYAFYEEKKDFNVINGVVKDPGDLYFAYYVNNEITREMPNKDSGLTLDTTKSSCNSGVTITWDDVNWHAIVDYSTYESNSTTRTKCTLYFTKKKELLNNYIRNLVKDANSSSNDVYTVPDKTSNSCTYTFAYDGTANNNLRYVGANPCNYVTFNSEKAGWRIIGILNTPEGQRVKLIRLKSIGKYSWDNKRSGTGSSTSSYGSNDWTDSPLKEVLNNGAYYNRISGTCPTGPGSTTACDFTSYGLTEETRSQIDTVTWKLGGSSSFTSSSNGLASHWYTYERGTTVYTGRPTEWQGKVGLMYPSDYGYATSGGSTTNRNSCLSKDLYHWDGTSSYGDCVYNDWLFNSGNYQWILTPNASDSDRVFSIGSLGAVYNARANDKYAVRPSVYLITSTAILGGEGTPENPYTIGE